MSLDGVMQAPGGKTSCRNPAPQFVVRVEGDVHLNAKG